MRKIIIIIALTTELMGCSVYKVLTQPGEADLSGIGSGTRREEIITRLGAPKFGDTDKNGNKQDIFEFQSGMHQASKIRALPYLAADVFTLSLAELILWPLELTAMDSATCIGIATYDSMLKVDRWSVARKKDSSAQDC
ncbi:hypothetical protein [Methylobacter tundripaludum]|uniref:hypothetical protein n=1 Tax=Methylobacter tundripaludum TaxID=173365 RepID=UPI0004DEE10B|nr:hypothetical protein [Methylobacter tundripaludum]